MKLPTLKEKEQAFLRLQLADRFYANNPKALSLRLNKTPKSYGQLFDDIANKLKLEEGDIMEDDDEQKSFKGYNQDKDIEYKCSWRNLRDFFHEEKQQLDNHTLNAFYEYITNGHYTRKEFLETHETFYVTIAQNERLSIVDKLWDSLNKESEEKAASKSLLEKIYEYLLAKVDKNLPDICLEKNTILELIDGREKDLILPITALNTFYYYISENKYNRKEYLEANPDFLKEQDVKQTYQEEDKKTIGWIEIPELPFIGFALTLTLTITTAIFIDGQINRWMLLSAIVIIMAFLGWLSMLYLQAQKDFKRGDKVRDFWIWIFKKPSVHSMKSIKGKVHVLIVHDNSFDIQEELSNVRENFKVVHTTEFVAKEDTEDLEKSLYGQRFDGIYLFLTDNLLQWSVPTIENWAVKYEGIPIVYVDYVGVNLNYGRITPDSDDSGLWLLLSQSLNRVSEWQRKTKVYEKYSVFGKIPLLIFALGMFLLAVHEDWQTGLLKEQKDDQATSLKRQISKGNEANIILSKKLLRDWRKEFIDKSIIPINKDDLNVSVFGHVGSDIYQYGRTEKDADLIKFHYTDTTIITHSFKRGYQKAIMVLKDPNTNEMTRYVVDDKYKITEDNTILWTDFKKKEKRNIRVGLICSSDKNNHVGVCIELLYENELSNRFLEYSTIKETIDFMDAKKIEAAKLFEPEVFSKLGQKYYKEKSRIKN